MTTNPVTAIAADDCCDPEESECCGPAATAAGCGCGC